MVIGPLDDRTYCARSAFTRLGLWRKLYTIVYCIISKPANVFSCQLCCIDICVDRQPYGCNWKGDLLDLTKSRLRPLHLRRGRVVKVLGVQARLHSAHRIDSVARPSGVVKSSTSFDCGYGGERRLCRVAGKTVRSRMTHKFP